MDNSFISQVQNLLDDIVLYLDTSTFGRRYVENFKSLQREINEPCVLAVAGKVKVGKSFLINALLGVDLAITGTTETTATINVFKRGKPLSKDKPVLCQWIDGTKEWKSKDFLDTLQGTDEETLNISSKIDRLTFYVDDNPLLEDVVLVDTPGIGADVGEDGDSHQIQTDAYFNLRQRHQKDTQNLSSNADAVLYLFNAESGPTSADKEFISALNNNGMGLTALNGIGILSKIDKNISQSENIPQFEQMFEKELFKIVPASAALSKYIPTYDEALSIQKQLRTGFDSEQWFKIAIKSERTFLDNKLPHCTLSIDERQTILNNFAKSDLAWSSFRLIATELYYSKNVQSTINNLVTISGIQRLNDLIHNHFFSRSRQLRCHRILNDMKRILVQMLYDDYFISAESIALKKQQCIDACAILPLEYKNMVISIIQNNVDDIDNIHQTKYKIQTYIANIEQVQDELNVTNSDFLSYQQLVSNKQLFTEKEFSELSSLFSGKGIDTSTAISRYKYWSAVANMSIPNSVKQVIAETAKQTYSQLMP